MTNQEKIADLKSARKVLKDEIERLEQEDLVQTFGACAPGYYRNEAGQCIVDSRT